MATQLLFNTFLFILLSIDKFRSLPLSNKIAVSYRVAILFLTVSSAFTIYLAA